MYTRRSQSGEWGGDQAIEGEAEREVRNATMLGF